MLVGVPLEERLTWRSWTTPKGVREKPIYRWFVFPHSYTPELVNGLIDGWGLEETDTILDPFAGAGTTVLAAKEKGIPAVGYDLSPLAVLAARAKVAPPSRERVEKTWKKLEQRLKVQSWSRRSCPGYPDLVSQALPGRLLVVFDWIKRSILDDVPAGSVRDLLLLGLLATIPRYSRAIATGGWLKWTRRRRDADTVAAAYSDLIEGMIEELPRKVARARAWRVQRGDARDLPDDDREYSAVITSPPYPNRHDYTRVFGVELMFGFLDWEQTRQLRYQSFHSHPEAKPHRPASTAYQRPRALDRLISGVRETADTPRLPAMLEGYFLDMYLCLREVRRVCRRGAKIAIVVGNAQYGGRPLLVDEFTADAGEQAGLICEKILVARYRGNSAQQMGLFGRVPSRESVVIFKRP